MPSLEEFTNAVKEYFQVGWWSLSAEQVDNYIRSEEAQEQILDQYNQSKKKYESGKTTREQILVGTASSIGNCLVYMYDGI